ELFDKNYQFQLEINWTNDYIAEEVLEELMQQKQQHPKKTIFKHPHYQLTHRLCQQLQKAAGISEGTIWADVHKKQLVQVTEQLTHRLLERLVKAARISEGTIWADVSKKQLVQLTEQRT